MDTMHHVLKAWCIFYWFHFDPQGRWGQKGQHQVCLSNRIILLVSAFGLFRYGHCKLFGSQQWLNIMLHRIKNGFHAQKCRNLLPCFRLMTKTPTDLRLARYLPLLSPLPLYYKALPRTRFCGFQISVPVSHIPSSHYAW